MMFCRSEARRLTTRIPINQIKSIPRISTYLSSAFLSSSSSTNQHSSRRASTNVGTPSQAQVVIAGGGVIGCSVAYHLAKLGWKDILLLEQGSVSGGTTWHAAGLLGKLRGTAVETYMSDYAATLYKRLEEETGLQSGFKKCGGLLLARNNDRLTAIKRTAVQARSYGITAEMISLKEAQEMWPLMRV